MIKTFEQFISTVYGRPVNEGFQSNKLRTIIKQHGLPKNDWDKKMLYDLQDDEIIDVVDNRKEYSAKYMSTPVSKIDWSEEQTFIIELEDGTCVVIGNLGIDKSHYFLDHIKSADDQKREIFKKRHSERHKGNPGNRGGDDIHKKHLEKVDELERRRFAEKMHPYMSEIVEKINSMMDDINMSELEDGDRNEISAELTLGGEAFTIYVNYIAECSDTRKEYGAVFYDVTCSLESFVIEDEDGNYATNEDFGIEEDDIDDLVEPHTEEDIEGYIYDHYEYYGVKRSDFY
jgi:hypothetical protein